MADRMPQFPMHPNGFTQTNMARPPQMMLGQGQQGQQPPQDNQAQAGLLAGGPPDARNWALASQHQMMQQLAHMQQRQPSDLASASTNPSQQQMNDFGRAPQHPLMSGLGQPPGMHPQAPFNPNQPSAVGGSDPQQALRNANMNMSLGGQAGMSQFMSAAGGNPASIQAAFQQQQRNMFQNQLERLQSGNPAAAAASRMMSMPGQQRPPQFSPQAMNAQVAMQGKPAFNPNPTLLDTNSFGGAPGQQGSMVRNDIPQQQQQQQQPSLQQLQATLISLRKWIENEEASLAQLISSRSTMPEAVFQERANRQRSEIQAKKQMFQKVNGIANATRQAMLTGATPMQQPNPALWQGNLNTGFPPLGAPSLNNPQGGPNPTMDPQSLQPGSQPNMAQMMKSSHVASGPAPGPSGSVGAGDLDSSKLLGPVPVPPPMPADEFQRIYMAFCTTNKIQHDERLMAIENRRIDLHKLHTEVTSAGGYLTVSQKELWPIIGGKMGYVQFHGNPPTCGPALAEKLHHIYREYLQHFDNMWAQRHARNNPRVNNAQRMAIMARFAYVPAEEMRAKGVTEDVVRLVEQWRPQLQSFMQTQKDLRDSVIGAGAPGPADGSAGASPLGHTRTPSLGTAPLGAQMPAQAPIPSNPGQLQTLVITQEDIQTTKRLMDGQKMAFLQQKSMSTKSFHIPPEQRREFVELLTNLLKLMAHLENRAPAIYQFVRTLPAMLEEWKKLVGIMACAQYQRSLLQPGVSPRFVLEAQTLQGMFTWSQRCAYSILGQMNKSAQVIFPNSTSGATQMNGPAGPSPAPPMNSSPALHPPTLPTNPTPAQAQAPLNTRRKPSVSHNVAARSSPVPGPPTPATSSMNGVTIAANAPSPRAPKSPKSKPKLAKAAPAKPGPVAKTPPASQTSSEVPVSGVKRPRDEEVEQKPTLVPAGPAMSPPKRQKTDWNGPVTEPVLQRQKDLDPNQSSEEVTMVLDRMMELFQSTDPQTSLEMENTLTQLLNGCVGGPATLLGETPAATDWVVFSTNGLVAPDSPSLGSTEDLFSTFLDFSNFGAPEEPPVPALEPSTSTNPSPASDVATTTPKLGTAPKAVAVAPASAPSLDDDLFHQSTWSEIGAEASYWQPNDGWKWSGTMPSADWAILQS